IQYKQGMARGKSTTFYPSGKLETVTTYDQSGRPLKEEAYHENGKLRKTLTFENGWEHGEAISYHENGEISTIIPYVRGRISGMYRIFDKEGNLIGKRTFENGNEISANPEGK